MKGLLSLLLVALFWIVAPNVYTQETKPEIIYKIISSGPDMTDNANEGGLQDMEATQLLYQEINIYRERNGLNPCEIYSKTVNYACRWSNYMVNQHKGLNDNFYQHSRLGPDSLHIPPTCSEIIHLLYFDHQPSPVEIVAGLMYGINRKTNSVTGWTQSEGHNKALLQELVKYYGASIYIIKSKDWWAVYSTVNFSTVK